MARAMPIYIYLPGQLMLGEYLDHKNKNLDNSDMYCLMKSLLVCLHICFVCELLCFLTQSNSLSAIFLYVNFYLTTG